jgi:hypothetical protein
MGEKAKEALRVQFDKRLRLEFQGVRITSDGGLLACRELDGALELTEIAPTYLEETREGRNVQHEIVPLLRQSVSSRLAGYEDTNDALRLARDPAMQPVKSGSRLAHRGNRMKKIGEVRSLFGFRPTSGLLNGCFGPPN